LYKGLVIQAFGLQAKHMVKGSGHHIGLALQSTAQGFGAGFVRQNGLPNYCTVANSPTAKRYPSITATAQAGRLDPTMSNARQRQI
jgi:hypothetical protein